MAEAVLHEPGWLAARRERAARLSGELGLPEFKGTPILVAAHRKGDALRIEVRDHGPGIAAADRQRIFDKFFRGQNADGTPGSGLGLAIARSLVVLHGGTLEYEENPGGGSAFVTLLPLAS